MHFWDKHKTITCYFESLSHSICKQYNLTQMEYDIIMFLQLNPKLNTAADIVKARRFTKSHVSTALKSLEQRGFISKRSSVANRRRVEIFLQNPAQTIVDAGARVHREFMRNLLEGISKDELRVFQAVFEKMCSNAERRLKHGQEREESKNSNAAKLPAEMICSEMVGAKDAAGDVDETACARKHEYGCANGNERASTQV